MDFSYYHLGHLYGGEIIEVSLSLSANVCLLNSWNFYKYKNGDSFSYYGGHATSSPCRLYVPHADDWYVTIDLGGYAGSLRHSLNIINPEYKDGSGSRKTEIESLRWQIQEDNPDCTVKVTSRWLEKHPQYGDPNTARTDFLVFDKSGNLHKHFSVGEDTNWELREWHDWY